MALTMAEANALLEKVTTPKELRELISRLDVTGSGSTTFLYSGEMIEKVDGKAIKTEVVARALADKNADIRIIDNTEAGKFLNYEKNPAFASKLKELFGDNFEDHTSPPSSQSI